MFLAGVVAEFLGFGFCFCFGNFYCGKVRDLHSGMQKYELD